MNEPCCVAKCGELTAMPTVCRALVLAYSTSSTYFPGWATGRDSCTSTCSTEGWLRDCVQDAHATNHPPLQLRQQRDPSHQVLTNLYLCETGFGCLGQGTQAHSCMSMKPFPGVGKAPDRGDRGVNAAVSKQKWHSHHCHCRWPSGGGRG